MKEHVEQIGDFLLGKTLGRGRYGKVKLGLNLTTGERVTAEGGCVPC